MMFLWRNKKIICLHLLFICPSSIAVHYGKKCSFTETTYITLSGGMDLAPAKATREIFYFSLKAYVVGTHLKPLNDALIMSTRKIDLRGDIKKTPTFLNDKRALRIWIYVLTHFFLLADLRTRI